MSEKNGNVILSAILLMAKRLHQIHWLNTPDKDPPPQDKGHPLDARMSFHIFQGTYFNKLMVKYRTVAEILVVR